MSRTVRSQQEGESFFFLASYQSTANAMGIAAGLTFGCFHTRLIKTLDSKEIVSSLCPVSGNGYQVYDIKAG